MASVFSYGHPGILSTFNVEHFYSDSIKSLIGQ